MLALAIPNVMATALPILELAPVTSAYCPFNIFSAGHNGIRHRQAIIWMCGVHFFISIDATLQFARG
jgi:hypothetical protein